MADLAMRILLEAHDTSMSGTVKNAVAMIENMGGSLANVGKRMSNAAALISNGFQNLSSGGLSTVKMGLGELGGSMVTIGNQMWKVAGIAAVAGGALAIGIGVKATEAAGQFQAAMLSNVAHAGLAKNQFDKVSQAVLKMSTDVGRSPTQLAEAMYPILSAFSGISNQSAKSAIALDTLKMSFQAVAGTAVNGTDVANAAVGTFNALGLATNNVSTNTARMKNLFDVMDLTVQQGNMQWDAYKNVISKLAVSIQGTGIKFNEASAALATMTNMGFSAQRAQTYLSNTFTTLAIKTDALATHAKKLGINFDAAKYGPMSLADKIKYLNEITDGNKQKLLALMGNNSTALKTFNALSTGIKGYQGNLNGLNHAQGALKNSFDEASKGMDFQMSRVKAGGQALLITIGTQLLPVVTKFAAQIVPLIQRFTDWIQKSGIVKTAATALANGLTTLGTWIGNITSFFEHNKVALQALQVVLILVGGFIATTMVAAFIAWAVAAGTAAISMIALTWPVLAIIAIIVLIVLAVKNWGAIVNWLQGVWGAFSSWFMGMLGGIGAWFQSGFGAIGAFFSGIWKSIQGVFGNIGGWFTDRFKQAASGTKSAWSGTQSFFGGVGKGIVGAFQGAAQQTVKNFQWLYNHNYYFKNLVDFAVAQFNNLKRGAQIIWTDIQKYIVQPIQAALAWLQGAWATATAWLSAQFRVISDRAKFEWQLVTQYITMYINQAISWLKGIWNTAISWLSAQWAKLAGLAQQAWQAVSQVFSSIWGTYIQGPLQGLWNSISGWFSNLASQAVSWGQGVIQGFITGLKNMLGQLGQTAQNAAGTIAKFLGFHSPAKAGPGSHLLEWPKNFVYTYADGLVRNAPAIESAVGVLATKLTVLTGAAIPKGYNPYSGVPHHARAATHHTTTHHRATTTHHRRSTTHHSNTIHITINAPARSRNEAQAIAQEVEKILSQKLNRSANLHTWSSGGKA